jgi:sugar phosphate isomerase/epimerase
MRLGTSDAHLTYCTNIHPGETWAEVKDNLVRHVRAVKQRVAPGRPFGVGLRLSAAAARELATPAARATLRSLLADNGMYVFTINAFPYGAFHGQAVKESVYRPDWLEPERRSYTDVVADLLSDLLADAQAIGGPSVNDSGLTGSISTVPGCFRPRAMASAAGDAFVLMGREVALAAVTLFRQREAGAPAIGLAIEPEPACACETTQEVATFLQQHVYAGAGHAAFTSATGLAPAAAEAALRQHVGVCLDACHAAVEFEAPTEGVDLLAAAGIPIFKLQVSTGLRIVRPDADKLRALARFAEGVYLHQVVIRRGDTLERIVDLPEALERPAGSGDCGRDYGDEWRVHFHVPVFHTKLGPFENTGAFLQTLLARAARTPFTRHLEVETYTFDVLPEEYRGEPVADAVARELAFTLAALGQAPPAHLASATPARGGF